MAPIVSLEDTLAYLDLEEDVNEKVARALDAYSAEVRRITRRGFEGVPTVYDEVLRVADAAVVVLPYAPVTEVLAVRHTDFNGTEDEILEPRVVTGGASTTLAAAAGVGATNLKLASVDDLVIGTHLHIGSGASGEVVRLTSVGTAGAGGTGVDVEPALRYAQADTTPAIEVAGSIYWRLELPRRGRVRLSRRTEYARFTWRVSGEIPAYVEQAFLTWLKTDWEAQINAPADAPELASQSSDAWSESYVADETTSITRRPPPAVARMLAGYFHPSGPAGAPS